MKLPIHLQNASSTKRLSTTLCSSKYLILGLFGLFNFINSGCSKTEEIPESNFTHFSDQRPTNYLTFSTRFNHHCLVRHHEVNRVQFMRPLIHSTIGTGVPLKRIILFTPSLISLTQILFGLRETI